jgi:predicted acyl esterase
MRTAGKRGESRIDLPGAGETVVTRDLVVTTRDGAGLATDVYRPAGHGPFPVLLERTPYDKSAPSRSERTAAVAQPRSRAEVAAYFVQHGYAVVYQDCRGRYKSAGRFRRFGAKPDKKIVDRQAASPSSWKTPFIATRMAW